MASFTQICMCELEKLVGFCKDFLRTASSISLIVAAKVNERSMLHLSFSCKLLVCVGAFLKLYSWVKVLNYWLLHFPLDLSIEISFGNCWKRHFWECSQGACPQNPPYFGVLLVPDVFLVCVYIKNFMLCSWKCISFFHQCSLYLL